MPWNSEGGGGNQGPWGQGPWGQGPRRPNGGGGRGPTPPDLDELIRRGQDKLKRVLPSGGGGRASWLVPVVLLGAFWVYNSINQVQADERGVVLRFGEYARTASPGLHFVMWPIETMEKPKVEAENQINFGGNESEGLMLAGDQNIVDIQFSVLWRIASPEDYLFNVVTPQEAMVRAVAESAMREVVGRTAAEEIRTTGRQKAQDEVRTITQATLDSYKAGILITSVNLEKADPPKPVIASFEEVQRAEQNQAQSINEADQYRNKELRTAEGAAAKLVEDAKAYKARVVAEAQGEAARFVSIYNEYKNAKDVTRQRLFLETMEMVLGQSNKVIVENTGGSGVVPYLPLPEIQKRSGGNP
ncbi:MAG: FtsH protease activity modulator HflK [Alphaproteobacteria bacterium]|nr:FtsH protease activity modulator HflK [Alphaproteobacteria bacterium]